MSPKRRQRKVLLKKVDYKMCSSSIAQRIKKALNEIISETQTESWRVETLVSVYDLYVTSYLMFWKIYCGDKFWYNTLYELESLTPKFDLFWRDAIVNYAKIHEMSSTANKQIERKMAKKIREDNFTRWLENCVLDIFDTLLNTV